MPELNISPHFTIQDIRKVRDYDFEMTRGMTIDEKFEYHRKGAEETLKEIDRIRRQNQYKSKAIGKK